MGIAINPELESRLRARAQAEGLSLEAYIERVIQSEELALRELESLALAGLCSGESFAPAPGYWEAKHRALDERLKQATAR